MRKITTYRHGLILEEKEYSLWYISHYKERLISKELVILNYLTCI